MANAKTANNSWQKILDRVVREQFPASAIEEVRTELDKDADGDSIIRVILVFKNDNKFDAVTASHLVQHLRQKLDDDIFPLLSFISASDNRKQQAEAG